MIAMKLRINREGEFVAHANSDHPQQCGKVGARNYKYFVSIEAGNKKLTPEGYVMENMWVDEYFQNRYSKEGAVCDSCENMAQQAVQHFLSLFGKVCGTPAIEELEGVEITRILVRIHGTPISFIEAEWVEGGNKC